MCFRLRLTSFGFYTVNGTITIAGCCKTDFLSEDRMNLSMSYSFMKLSTRKYKLELKELRWCHLKLLSRNALSSWHFILRWCATMISEVTEKAWFLHRKIFCNNSKCQERFWKSWTLRWICWRFNLKYN
jgi:hypothetical protein